MQKLTFILPILGGCLMGEAVTQHISVYYTCVDVVSSFGLLFLGIYFTKKPNL